MNSSLKLFGAEGWFVWLGCFGGEFGWEVRLSRLVDSFRWIV